MELKRRALCLSCKNPHDSTTQLAAKDAEISRLTHGKDGVEALRGDLYERDAELKRLNSLLDRAVEALKSVETITVTDGCGECSAVWQRSYGLRAVDDALKDIRAARDGETAEGEG